MKTKINKIIIFKKKKKKKKKNFKKKKKNSYGRLTIPINTLFKV